MNADGVSASRRSRLVVLDVRLGRFLWRVLPFLGVALLVWSGVRIFAAGPDLLRLTDILVQGILGFAGIRAVIKETLAPEQPDLRFFPMENSDARLLTAGLVFFVSVAVSAEVGRRLIEAAQWHLSVALLLDVVRNVALLAAGALLLGATGLFRWLRTRSNQTFWGLIAGFAGKILVPLVLLALLFLLVARGLGYVPLANYVARNLVETGVRLVGGVVAYHYLRRGLGNLLHYLKGDEGDATETNPAILGVERIALATLRLVVTVGTLVWVLLAWDFTLSTAWRALAGPIFEGGGVTWAQVMGSVLSVVLVIAVGNVLRTVLTYFVFPRMTMEVGARYAILAVLRYLTIGLAILFALGSLGLDTSSLGWFFGAAGVGLGLGLQDVIGNFFSGIIMLVERPIRVGDTVQVGDAVGKVEDIRMRGTVIRTFDNTSVMIPNRQMLGERVTNLSYGMQRARVKIQLGVEYGTDPEKVKAILGAEALKHPDILDDPAPLVWFSDFGVSSLDFTLLCHTARVTARASVASELRFAILARLRREHIQIAFPQLDVRVKDLPPGISAPPPPSA